MVEEPSSRCRNELEACQALLSHGSLSIGSIQLLPRYIQIACEDDVLAHRNQISNSSVKDIEKATSEVISGFITVRWTVNAQDNERWEFENHTSTLRIESRGVNDGSC